MDAMCAGVQGVEAGLVSRLSSCISDSDSFLLQSPWKHSSSEHDNMSLPK